MGKIPPDEERYIRDKVNKDKALISEFYPEFARRPDEMKKMVEAIDLLIANWLRTRPETGEVLRDFFARQAAIICNHYSQYVAVEFRKFCESLMKNFSDGATIFMDVEKDGKKEQYEAHLLDLIIVRRNFLAAYLGDELKCFYDYCPPDDSSVSEPS